MGLIYRPLASSSKGCMGIVSCDDTHILVDAGLAYGTLKRNRCFAVSDIAGGVITHSHGDHVKSVGELAKRGVAFYSSAETKERLGIADLVECSHGEPFMVGGIEVMPFELPHGDIITFGYAFSNGEHTLCYATDMSHFPYPINDINVLCIETNYSEKIVDKMFQAGAISLAHKKNTEAHFSIEQLEWLLRDNDISALETVWLLHLSDLCSNAVEFEQRIKELITEVEVHVAKK